MDALTLLKDDHDKMKKLLSELERTTERGVKTRQELFTTVKEELTVHESIEEEIFYPALKEHPKTKELTLEAYEEHHVVDTVMAEIEAVPFDDERWGREVHGHEGEPRAPHRGRGRRDVQAGPAGLREGRAPAARRADAGPQGTARAATVGGIGATS